MASSFNGVTITVLADGTPRKFAGDIVVRHIPGGTISYVDIGGSTLRVLDLSLLFLSGSDAVSFESQVGQQGTLIVSDGTYTALLSSLQRTSRGVATSGPTVLTAEFYIL
jgi:hypothetical protein